MGREKAGIYTEGPKICVTPLAVFDFDQETKQMRIRSVHEGITLQEVIENTGFELIIPQEVPVTSPPTEEELQLIREEIDPKGILLRRP